MFVDIISMRKGARRPAHFYSVVEVDRSHSVLGNRHYLADLNNLNERLLVIEGFNEDLRKDEVINGPMTQAIDELCERVEGGEYLALACWCSPLPCHAESIRAQMERKLGRCLLPRG